jgi:hypothetical protein
VLDDAAPDRVREALMAGCVPGATEALHRSEGGIEQLHAGAGPAAYARHIARYIACPSTVRARTIEEFGKAPSLDEIRQMRARHVEARDAYRRIVETIGEDDEDAEPYRVPTRRFLRKLYPDPVPTPAPPRSRPLSAPPLVPDLIEAIAREFRLSADDLIGRRRQQLVVTARQTCAYVLVARGNSNKLVGRWLGGRDHSTIIHACRQFEQFATPAMRAIADRYVGAGR